MSPQWRQRIVSEYREMPDLMLTTEEAARFWGLDRTTAERWLEELREERVLSRTAHGSYRLR